MNKSLLNEKMHAPESGTGVWNEKDFFANIDPSEIEIIDVNVLPDNLATQILSVSQESSFDNKSEEILIHPGGPSNETPSRNSSSKDTNFESNSQSLELNDFETKILTFLEQDPTAKLVFAHYRQHKSLDKSSRALLTRCIIGRFRDEALKDFNESGPIEKFNISRPIFLILSKLIEKIFPGESACTYYSPYKNENGCVVQTTGTLWSNYNYTIEILRRNKALKLPSYSLEKKPEVVQSSNDKLAVEIAVNNLTNAINSASLVADWKITFNFRNIQLSAEKIPISDYLNKYPILKTDDAKQMFELDFEYHFPEKKDLLKIRWPVLRSVIISQLNQLEAKSASNRSKLTLKDRLLIKGLEKLAEEKKDAVVFYLLQNLISSGNFGKRKKSEVNNVTKFTPEEIRLSFITLVKQNSELEAEVNKRRIYATQNKETLQPFVCAVGQDYDAIEEYYTALDNQLYKVSSCIEAFDLTFKIFFSLDCAYPKQSSRLWQFLQLAGFDIVLPETVIKCVKELVGLSKTELEKAGILSSVKN